MAVLETAADSAAAWRRIRKAVGPDLKGPVEPRFQKLLDDWRAPA